MAKDETNAYVCKTCRRVMVTVDLEEGVTPMMLNCDMCPGTAYSCFYRVPPDLIPQYAWKKPEPADYGKYRKEVRAAVREHVERGGLCLYRIGKDLTELTLVTK